MTDPWRDRIVSTPDVCHGKPCFHGTRVLVSVVFDSLADGDDEATILASYPTLSPGDVRAALLYAADLARGGLISA